MCVCERVNVHFSFSESDQPDRMRTRDHPVPLSTMPIVEAMGQTPARWREGKPLTVRLSPAMQATLDRFRDSMAVCCSLVLYPL